MAKQQDESGKQDQHQFTAMDLYNGITNLEMEKRRLMEFDMDPVLVCVNPYDVNPLFMEKAEKVDSSKDVSPTCLETNSRNTSIFGSQLTPIKLEMEEFGDLSRFVLSKPALINSVDELNTPIFDKDAFDFGTNTMNTNININNNILSTCNNNNNSHTDKQRILQQNEPYVKTEHDLNTTCSFAKFRDSFMMDKEETATPTTSSVTTPTVHLQNSFIQKNMYDSAFSVRNVNVSSPEGNVAMTHRPERLSLNVNVRIPPVQGFDLTTPSIIEDVVDLEASANFDILEVEEEDPHVRDEILDFSATIPVSSLENVLTRQEKRAHVPKKRPKSKRKQLDEDDDDDDDYLPPSLKRRLTHQRDVSSNSDSDSDVEVQVKSSKSRGRPPKRTGSISSECSKDSDASKYRELRDKNNEASRKSRLKRKIKELEMEKEANDLTSRNIKLKAQVEELEKLVTNFRDNLFKIMMKK